MSRAEELGECKVVEGADWDLELGTLTDLLSSEGRGPGGRKCNNFLIFSRPIL